MNTTNDDNLKTAAEAGDINLLYSVIQDDPSVLERIDLIQFVETPLHIAAFKGHLQFATEVARLKPSFAWKLNQQGFSPIHLAMQNNQKWMVLRFVDINKDLVRIKGREGLTPLHLASQAGESDLLAKFLVACPESIEDVTVRCETALHIAVKNEQYEALKVLVGWLQRNTRRGAEELEYEILHWKDEAGNTILHVSVQNNQSQALQFLLMTMTNLNAKNLQNETALDIARDTVINSMLSDAGAKLGSEVTDTPTHAHKLRSKITSMGKVLTVIRRIKMDLTDEQRNALLVVATLVVTATYQSALTPPGGVYQVSAGDNNVNTTSLNSANTAIPRNVGKSILSKDAFIIFSIFDMLSLWVSIMAIYILTPDGTMGSLVFMPVNWFVLCYLFSIVTVSSTNFNFIIAQIILCYILVCLACSAVILLYSEVERYAKKEEIYDSYSNCYKFTSLLCRLSRPFILLFKKEDQSRLCVEDRW